MHSVSFFTEMCVSDAGASAGSDSRSICSSAGQIDGARVADPQAHPLERLGLARGDGADLIDLGPQARCRATDRRPVARRT